MRFRREWKWAAQNQGIGSPEVELGDIRKKRRREGKSFVIETREKVGMCEYHVQKSWPKC